MSNFVLSGLIVGIIVLIFFTPHLLAKGVASLANEDSMGVKVITWIPVVNTIWAEKTYLGKVGFHCIATIFEIVAVVARVIQWRYAYANITLGLICMGAFWLGLLLFVISNCILVYTIIHDAQAMTGFKLILFTIAYPFGQYYIGAYLANVIRHMQEKEETFKR